MNLTELCINTYLNNKKIIFFGAGQHSQRFIERTKYDGYYYIANYISSFVDNFSNLVENDMYGIPVISFNELLAKYPKDEIIIVVMALYDNAISIFKQLKEAGYNTFYLVDIEYGVHYIDDSHTRIIDGHTVVKYQRSFIYTIKDIDLDTLYSKENVDLVLDLLCDDISKRVFLKRIDAYKSLNTDFSEVYTNDKQYFNSIFEDFRLDNEVYVDAGVFNPATLLDFIQFNNGQFLNIYAFEPDSKSYEKISKEIGNIDKINIIPAGLSDKDEEVVFDMRDDGSAKILDKNEQPLANTEVVSLKSLDTFLNEPPTFIKMDIEGHEQKALLGAKNIIIKHKPKLAICVYHKPDDLINIPLLLSEWVPEYKFYLRHHNRFWYETVLYAVVEK